MLGCVSKPLLLRAVFPLLALLGACGGGDENTAESSGGLMEIANPSEPGASGVNLADDLMSWMVPGPDGTTALRYARYEGGEWSGPVTVAQGERWFVNWADFPSVVAIDEDFLAAHWLQKSGAAPYAYDVMLSLSTDGGREWSTPFSPHDDGTKTEHGFVSLFRDRGDLGVAWLDGRAMATDKSGAMSLRSSTIDRRGNTVATQVVDERVCECCQTDVYSSRNRAYLVYRNRSETEVRDIALAQGSRGAWSNGRIVVADGWRIDACPVNGPAIDGSGSSIAYAWFSAAGDQRRVRLVRSTDNGASFAEAALDAAVDPLGRVDVAVLHDGRIVVSWLERRDDNRAELKLQTFALHGQSFEPISVATVTAAYSSGFPQITSVGNELLIAWTDVVEDATRIRTARIATSRL